MILDREKLHAYISLARLDKPVGIFLLLWPTLWALWLAAEGLPSWQNVLIFCLGVVLMRSAGCVINDFADRHVDGLVERTKDRPLVSHRLSSKEALWFFTVLCAAAAVLVLFTNPLTIYLSVGGLVLASAYPFMKRYTYLPQVVLGAAFAWAIPMAFAAEAGEIPGNAWLLYVVTLIWTVAYDTLYAMVDRDDDIKAGIKSTAILFGDADKLVIAVLQLMVVLGLALLGQRAELGAFYFYALIPVSISFVYQQHLIRHRYRASCFKAFQHNNWVGGLVFLGLLIDSLRA